MEKIMTITEKYINHLETCFNKAHNKESKLIDDIHNIPGMTGEMTRCFYNNLLSMDDAYLLEIGCWQGSSSCSAMYGNKATVVLIDNWSGFGGPKEQFLDNYEKFKGENDALFIEADCFKINLSVILNIKFNIYCFDGDHSEISQFMALDYHLPVMDDIFIFVVDDANWLSVRQGTNRAIQKNNLEILWSKQILTTDDGTFPPQDIAKSTWWNGIQVFLLKKPNK